MDTIAKALDLATEQFKKEHGADAKLEVGEEFCTVFNDAVIIIGMGEERNLQVKILAGEPYRIDFNLDLIEKESEQ